MRFAENLLRRGLSASGEKEESLSLRYIYYREVVNRLINFRRASVASGI